MLLIFDFDGTIADGLPVLLPVANKYFKTNFTKTEVREKGMTRLIKELHISKFLLPVYIWKSRQEVSRLINKVQAVNGAKRAIKILQTKHELAIVTSNSKANVEAFLYKEKLHDYFKTTKTSLFYQGKHKKITAIMKKSGYAPSQTVYIGDEVRDIIAAKEAGVKSIAVTWGFESKALLIKAGPDWVISNPGALTSLL